MLFALVDGSCTYDGSMECNDDFIDASTKPLDIDNDQKRSIISVKGKMSVFV